MILLRSALYTLVSDLNDLNSFMVLLVHRAYSNSFLVLLVHRAYSSGMQLLLGR